MERRPIKTRSQQWAHRLSAGLRRLGLTPNQVSVLSLIFAASASGLLLWQPAGPFWPAVAATCIQCRLLCNMLDGLMAVEGGASSRTGELFNEFPDRLADVGILVGAGYAARWPVLGWAAAVAAVLTAYVRAFGGALGCWQDFCGPFAKPQRMFVVTLGCVVASAERLLGWPPRALVVALIVVLAGTLVTVIRRVVRLAQALEAT